MNNKPQFISFEEVKKQLFADPKFKTEYDKLTPEYDIIKAVLRKRIEKHMSQKQMAEKMGTKQSALSRLESGTYNPTLSFLKKVATALGEPLTITINPSK